MVPRSTHGEWASAPDRPDPIDLLEAQARNRIPYYRFSCVLAALADDPYYFITDPGLAWEQIVPFLDALSTSDMQ
jgi:hypothetical protein